MIDRTPRPRPNLGPRGFASAVKHADTTTGKKRVEPKGAIRKGDVSNHSQRLAAPVL
jgi:hypothetical protein